ncbi:MAG: thioredoxin family protein [Fimbriimonadaceae bacterium]|nr:thioredoxin family protein [Fimbriimonadaceae bacterium]
MKTRLISLALVALISVGAFAQTPKDVKTLLAEAGSKAKSEKKNVLVVFHASWCGWCHKFEDFMALKQFAPVFDANYVTVRVDVMEQPDKASLMNPGGGELLTKLTGGVQTGIPYFAVLDPSGKKIMDSIRPVEGKKGGNIGHPAAPEEIAWFMEVLKKTAKHMKPAESKAIEDWLKAQKLG